MASPFVAIRSSHFVNPKVSESDLASVVARVKAIVLPVAGSGNLYLP